MEDSNTFTETSPPPILPLVSPADSLFCKDFKNIQTSGPLYLQFSLTPKNRLGYPVFLPLPDLLDSAFSLFVSFRLTTF